MFTETRLTQGVRLYVRRTEQFKTVTFSIRFKQPLTSEGASERAVLANILEDSTETYPSRAALRQVLETMYGTLYYTDVGKRGGYHYLSVNAECVDDRLIRDENITDWTIRLLADAVLRPNLQDGVFKQQVFEREKQTVLERVRSLYDDKTRFAQQRLLTLLRPEGPESIRATGEEAHLEALTPEKTMAAYRRMIDEDEIEIYVVGAVDEEAVTSALKEAFHFEGRVPAVLPEKAERGNGKEGRVSEKQNMKQGKLHIGFSTPVLFGTEDFPKMQLANGIFGGFPHSKLFMNVREKESMAYYAASSYLSRYGLITVSAGIDADLADKATKLIDEQLEAMRAGEISDEELSQTKAMLANQLREALDSSRGQIEIFDQYKDLPGGFTPEGWITKWEPVTPEDIRKMAEKIERQLVYLLSGKEESADANA
ncbi:insulinase family protein [Bhargavaea ginsengi]|uniref:EF-P 5-aminopentanol modification-associated protein YfmF n=1 Tax=Bhargavaea ginsengi TaxID=426757 RepID=UPI002041618E|nr:pitrilysin family protein [Bhargavaea ginsengi]MCM3089048.1 insulinase family protein [Bhargavaea ginsengi]